MTPLYHSSMVGGDPYCCELLLHDHAQVGCVDENGWQEIHQVIHTDKHTQIEQWWAVCRIQMQVQGKRSCLVFGVSLNWFLCFPQFENFFCGGRTPWEGSYAGWKLQLGKKVIFFQSICTFPTSFPSRRNKYKYLKNFFCKCMWVGCSNHYSNRCSNHYWYMAQFIVWPPTPVHIHTLTTLKTLTLTTTKMSLPIRTVAVSILSEVQEMSYWDFRVHWYPQSYSFCCCCSCI